MCREHLLRAIAVAISGEPFERRPWVPRHCVCETRREPALLLEKGLVQNFVLLRLETAEAEWASDHFEWQLPLPVPRGEWPSKVALVGWVTSLDDPTPIQAAGAELPQD